jgi:hypothetical protein
MITTAVWLSGVVLELLILARCAKTGSFRVYPFFCVYLGCVFAGDVALPYLYRAVSSNAYRMCYWAKEFVCVIAGYAVVMEIIERAFDGYEGPKKLGRNAALAIFTAIVGATALQAALDRLTSSAHRPIDIEVCLRGAELILLAIVIVVISYYGVPVGRNLKGITIGYGICTAAVVMNEAVGSFEGRHFYAVFATTWSYSYLVSLVIWAVALWSYEPNKTPEGRTLMDGDYQALANRTRLALAVMRGHLRKAARP